MQIRTSAFMTMAAAFISATTHTVDTLVAAMKAFNFTATDRTASVGV